MYNSKRRYFKRSRISDKKIREIIKYFSLDFTITKISILVNIDRKIVNKYINKIRVILCSYCEKISLFKGEIELDESYFGGNKKGDKRGRGVTNKIPVFGILKRDGKVYTQIVNNASSKELMPIIKDLVDKKSTIYTDKWRAYDSLVLDGYKHKRINHSKEFRDKVDKKNHINGIENFWGWSKNRLRKFNGISRETFKLHLKECEFRFNHRHHNLYDIIIKILKNYR